MSVIKGQTASNNTLTKDVTVSEDAPNNKVALDVAIVSGGASIVAGGSTEAKQDDIIVELQNINNIDALTDNIQISDGVNDAEVTANNELQVKDSDVESELQSQTTILNTIATNTAGGGGGGGDASAANQATMISELQGIEADVEQGNTTLSSILTELEGKADLSETQPVSVSNFPTGQAVEAKQDTIISNIQSLLTELQAKADLTETQPVSLASTPLATGASTESKQDDVIAELQDIEADVEASNTALSNILTELEGKADLGETQPVSAASLPLPSGAATEAKQDTQITELQGINEKLLGNVIPENWDNIAITYVAAGNGVGEIETVVYSLSASTVRTLTLTYNSDNEVSNIARS